MKKKIYAALAFALYATTFHAQQIYELSAPAKEKTIYTGHLKMGGSNPSGGNISVNSYYMSIDGKPVIPVMGEFHFTRYPRAQWEQEIVKMKAGGVNVLPTYIFWGLHEEEEGKFCWSGNKDLRLHTRLAFRPSGGCTQQSASIPLLCKKTLWRDRPATARIVL